MVLETFRLTNDLVWDTANWRAFDDVIVNQGDANGRKMRVQVINRGVVENLTGAGLNLAWKATNGKGLDKFTAVNAAQGIFEISFTKGMLANVGRIDASLQLILPSGGGIVESRPFVIRNQASMVDQDSAQSTDSWTALENALAGVENLEAQYMPKLFSMEQKLSEKANENEVRKKSVPIGLNDAAPDLLQAVSDSPGTPINILSIPRNHSVTHDKTTFAEKVVLSDNMIDPSEITVGYTLNTNTGEPLANSLYNTTGFTKVYAQNLYSLPYTTNIYKFDLNQNYIGFETGISFTPAEDVLVRIRISAGSTVPFRLNKGPLKTWDEYKYSTEIKNLTLDDEKIKDIIYPNNELPENIEIPQDRLSFIYRNSPNLFNKDTVTLDKRLSSGNTTVDDINNTISDYIEAFPETTYSVTEGSYTHFLGENDQFISGHGVGIKTFTTPPGTKRIKTTVRKSKLNVFMMVLGDVPPTEADYVPYDKYAFTDNIEVARETKPFEGQSLAFNGDSIVQNGGYMLSQIKNALGFATVTNYGIGGTAYTPRLAPWDTNAISLRYTEMSNDHDVIAFLAGTNDFKSPEITLETFRQSVRITFEGLVSKYPTKKLVVFTMPPRYDKTANGETVFQYADVLLEEAGKQSIPCFDLLRFSQLRPWNEENKAAFIPDGLHPSTPDGYDLMLPKMIESFKTI